MAREKRPLGKIVISPRAIASVVAHAASQSYGVVGMAPKNLVDGIANALAHDPRHGVEVRVTEDEIVIDVFIIVEYGTRIASVATSIANAVQYQVERTIGMRVAAVDVHVQGLRVSSTD
jgi:uncharacterized alkaline shock family protein YloU